MTVDPAKFIVRNNLYPQRRRYPRFCAGVTEELITLNPKSLNDFVNYVSIQIQERNAHNVDAIVAGDFIERYGKLRDPDVVRNKQPRTDLSSDGRYMAASRRYADRYGLTKDQVYIVTYIPRQGISGDVIGDSPNDSERPIHLSLIICTAKAGSPPVMEITHGYSADEHERLWAAMSQLFLIAQNPKTPPEERVDSALELYYLLSHDCSFRRRSATLARICLAYFEEVIPELKIGFLKENIDLNTEALLHHTHQEFIQTVKSGELYDPTISSTEILGWHQRQAAAQREFLNVRR